MKTEFTEEYKQYIKNERKFNFDTYNYWIKNGLDSTITFEEFLLIRLDSQKDEYNRLMKEFVKLNPSHFQEIDEMCEEYFDSLKKWDKEVEEKFKEEYQ